MKKILLVEDEEGLIMTLTDRLQSENLDVSTAKDGIAGLNLALSQKFDLIILDVMLPLKNGFDVCRDLRRKDTEMPILMLTAKGETFDKVLGLKLGADDYLTKPFEIVELSARIEALLRRSGKSGNQSVRKICFGDVSVDFESAEVFKSNQKIELSAMEFKLLQFLVENPQILHSRNKLLDMVWGYDAIPSTRTVDVHIAWLRQKLEDNPKHPKFIQTVHGLGYKFTN